MGFILCWESTFLPPICSFIWRPASCFPEKMEAAPRQCLLAPLCWHPPAYKWLVSSLPFPMLPSRVTPDCTHDPFPCSIQSLANSSSSSCHSCPYCTRFSPRACTCTNMFPTLKNKTPDLQHKLLSLSSVSFCWETHQKNWLNRVPTNPSLPILSWIYPIQLIKALILLL